MKKLLRKDGLELLGVYESHSTLLRWEAAGLFPKRIKLAGFRVAWVESEVLEWIEQCSEKRVQEMEVQRDL